MSFSFTGNEESSRAASNFAPNLLLRRHYHAACNKKGHKDDTLVLDNIFVPVHHPDHISLYAFDIHWKKVVMCLGSVKRDIGMQEKDIAERHANSTELKISRAL
ncbi:hypothetical protein ACP4OV_021480 [Aristida adscensionis]